MVSKYYEKGEMRSAKVHELFSAIAVRYDRINDLQSFGLHRIWKRRMELLACPKHGTLALDLCCGTGDVALAMARSGADVVGVDFVNPMLSLARSRARSGGFEQKCNGFNSEPQRSNQGRGQKSSTSANSTAGSIVFIQGDALRIPIADDQFDVVTMSYGLRNLANFKSGLSEAHRVLKPGGRFVILDFGKPGNAVWRKIYFAYLGFLVPFFGRVFCNDADAYAYILESLHHYPGQKSVAEMLTGCGFEKTETINLLGGVMSLVYGTKTAKG